MSGLDRRWWIVGALVTVIAAVAIAWLLVGDDDDDGAADIAATSSTSTSTSSSESSTTVAPTSSTATATTATSTTSAGPPTVPPAVCVSSGPDEPETTAQLLYHAFTLGDRACADTLMTDEAAEALFAIPGAGGGWTFQGCVDGDEPEEVDCAYTFTGGSTHLGMRYGALAGWEVFEVFQVAD
jgi:hypothetical protein